MNGNFGKRIIGVGINCNGVGGVDENIAVERGIVEDVSTALVDSD